MLNPNFIKRPYHAQCLQWDGTNTDAVLAMLTSAESNAELKGNKCIMIRYGTGITTLYHGDYVVKGENNKVKCYPPEVFNIKYQPFAGAPSL